MRKINKNKFIKSLFRGEWLKMGQTKKAIILMIALKISFVFG